MPSRTSALTFTLLLSVSTAGLAFATGTPPSALSPGDVAVDPVAGTWSQLPFAPASLPEKRMTHSVIRDPVRNRLITFGGWNGSNFLGDTWSASLEGVVVWKPLPTAGTAPTTRRGHSAIYDPIRDRMLVFGGVRGTGDSQLLNEVWELSLSDPPTWQQIFPLGTSPSPRFVNGYAYDPVADRLLVFGGYDGAFVNDTWQLSLAGTPTWTQLFPAGTPPSGRDDLPSIYDPVRQRLLIFGGFDGTTPLNDLWALTLDGEPSWEQLPPAGSVPEPRRTSSLAYDAAEDRFLLFGGLDIVTGYNDVWALTFGESAEWEKLEVPAPAPHIRWGQTAAVDPLANRLVVFGGGAHHEIFNDTWQLSLEPSPVWSQADEIVSPNPGPRRAHAAVYDAAREQVVVFGGVRDHPDATRLNDVWVLPMGEGGGWEELHPAGIPPGGRFVPAAAFDAARGRLLIFGGYDGDFRDDTWMLQLGDEPEWFPIEPVGERPPARNDVHGIYDPVNDRFVIFGGFDGVQIRNDVWALSLGGGQPTWTKLEPLGQPPSPRKTTSVTYDPVRRRMIVFGGWDGGGGFNDVFWLSLDRRPVWRRLNMPSEAPEARWGHAAAYDPHRDRLLVMGGVSVRDWLNDVWSLSLGRPMAWAQLAPDGPLPGRRLTHSATYDAARQRLIVYGGYIGISYLSDTWSLSFLEEGDPQPLGALASPVSEPPGRLGVWPNPLGMGKDLRLAFVAPAAAKGKETVALRVALYDVRGRRVATLHDGPAPVRDGRVSLTWGAGDRAQLDLGAGIYFLSVAQPNGAFRHRERIVLLR